MTKFYIDGSAKGLTMGYGIVEVDNIGFMKLYEGYTLHPLATSNMAELYALEETLKLINTMDSKSEYTIILDQYRILRLFEYTINEGNVSFTKGLPLEDAAYVERIRELFSSVVSRLHPYGKLRLHKIISDANASEIVYENTAHKLSRNYFTVVEGIYMQEDSPLLTEGSESKRLINRFTKTERIGFTTNEDNQIHVDVTLDDCQWYIHFEGKQVNSSKSLATAILICREIIHAELGDIEGIQICYNSEKYLKRSLTVSQTTEDCPEDIVEKINEINRLVSTKEIRLISVGYTPSVNNRINLDVKFDGNQWSTFYLGKEVAYAKSIVNALLITMDTIELEINDMSNLKVCFFSDVNLYRSLMNSLSYEKCPDVIREKGSVVLDLIEKGQIQLINIGYSPSANNRINLDVNYDGTNWYIKYVDKDVIHSKSLVKAIDIALASIKNELGDISQYVISFFSETNMYRAFQNSINYENCPKFIFEKGNEIKELIDARQIRLVCKRHQLV